MAGNESRERTGQGLAVGLGWFSVGLGLAELAAPRRVATLIGVPADESTESVLRAMGARELANGIAILAQPDRAAWLWSRVGGDTLDLSLLGTAMSSERADWGRLSGAIAAVLGVTALDVKAAQDLGRAAAAPDAAARRQPNSVRVEKAITINKPIEQVYAFWHNFENLPRFMRHLESVRVAGDRLSHWRTKGPAGSSFEWEAETVVDRENEWIAWRSLEGSDVRNSGSVRFQRAPGARGTEVRVQLEYSPPVGAIGRTIARLFGEEPEQQIADDLRRFKQLMETGEIPISDGPALWRAAQPAANPDDVRSLAGVRS